MPTAAELRDLATELGCVELHLEGDGSYSSCPITDGSVFASSAEEDAAADRALDDFYLATLVM